MFGLKCEFCELLLLSIDQFANKLPTDLDLNSGIHFLFSYCLIELFIQLTLKTNQLNVNVELLGIVLKMQKLFEWRLVLFTQKKKIVIEITGNVQRGAFASWHASLSINLTNFMVMLTKIAIFDWCTLECFNLFHQKFTIVAFNYRLHYANFLLIKTVHSPRNAKFQGGNPQMYRYTFQSIIR